MRRRRAELKADVEGWMAQFVNVYYTENFSPLAAAHTFTGKWMALISSDVIAIKGSGERE